MILRIVWWIALKIFRKWLHAFKGIRLAEADQPLIVVYSITYALIAIFTTICVI